MDWLQKNRQATISSPLGDGVLVLQELVGIERLSEDFEYQATVCSGDSSIDGHQLIGKPVTVAYASEGGRSRHINGMVSRFEYLRQLDEPVGQTAYRLYLVPWLWFLRSNRDCRIFQDMKTPDIIRQIFDDRGFADFRLDLTDTYASREYCVQYRESDFDFVSRLMEEEGIFYYYEHTNDKHTLVLGDSVSSYIKLEDDEVKYTTVGQAQFHQLTEWRHIYEFRPGKAAQRDYDFKKPTDRLETERSAKSIRFEKSNDFEVFDYPGRYVEAGDGQRLTKVRMEEIEAEHDFIEGSGSYTTFSPGGKFKVAKHLRASEEGKEYVLVEVVTEFRSNVGFDSGGGQDFTNQFKCIPATTVFRPSCRTPKPIVEGPQTAIVVTDGQEIVVDEYGRVKVQFHWDRYGNRDIDSSCWIRVSQHHAGKAWGMIDIPRKDEEVIVSFLDGDPDRPIITGRVYNGDNSPPYSLKGAGNNSKFKTRRGNTTKTYESSEGYNEFSMDDTEGEEQIRLHAQFNMDQHVRNDSMEHVQNDRYLVVGGSGNDEGGNQTELVYSDKSLNVKHNQIEQVEGNMQLTVGEGQDSDGGKLDIVVGKQRVEQIGKEGSDLKVLGDRRVQVDKTDSLTVAKDQMHEIKAAQHLNVKGDRNVKVGGSNSLDVGMNHEQKVGVKHAVEAGQEIHLKAGMRVIIESGVQVSLVGPGGFVDIGPAGVTVQGIMVKINSGGAAGTGSGAKPKSPEAPKPPAEAAQAKPKQPLEADVYKE